MADETEKPAINGAELPPAFDPILKLSKPVIGADGVHINELTFREPTGADIEEIGIPVRPNFTIDTAVMGAMMAALAKVPPGTIKRLDSRDWTTGAYKLWTFFMPAPR